MSDIESSIVADRNRGVIVWELSPWVARFYADLLANAERARGPGYRGQGVMDDIRALRVQADLADPSHESEVF